MRTTTGIARRSLFLTTLLGAIVGCGGGGSSGDLSEAPGWASARARPGTLEPWALPAAQATGTPVEKRLEELGFGPERFEPLRARYLQTIHDAPGEVASRLFVTIQLDRAVQSGAWDGTYPARIPGLREPGLIVDWQIQNSIYNAFDRVLTDRHLGMRQRLMPGGSSVAGLVMGVVTDGIHMRLVADPTASADGPGGTAEDVLRTPLPRGTVNVLTAPLVLSQMDLAEGDLFSLPGYALIGGPGGAGTPWVGLYEVLSVADRSAEGGPRKVVDVLFGRRPDGWSGDSELRSREGRVTRIVVTPDPPYLLAREDYEIAADGTVRPVREHLHLVDWRRLPLAGADLVPESLWNIELDRELFNLDPDHLPDVIAPGR